jgi:hypothetical protein
MGITIHYTLATSSPDKVRAIAEKAVSSAKALAEMGINYEVVELNEPVIVDAFRTTLEVRHLSEDVVGDLKAGKLVIFNRKPTYEEIVKAELEGRMIITPPGFWGFDAWLRRLKAGIAEVTHWSLFPAVLWKSSTSEIKESGLKTEGLGAFINPEPTESVGFVFAKVGDLWYCKDFVKTQPFEEDAFLQCGFVHMWICSLLHEVEEERLATVKVEDEAEYYGTGDVKRMYGNFGANLALINSLVGALSDMGYEVRRGSDV